ncbi:MAG: hypothetical protein F6K26_07990 [Moorea sp. SIO2I5]|nr:hypothetical protein [Moorena sp. SIO2I5]
MRYKFLGFREQGIENREQVKNPVYRIVMKNAVVAPAERITLDFHSYEQQ